MFFFIGAAPLGIRGAGRAAGRAFRTAHRASTTISIGSARSATDTKKALEGGDSTSSARCSPSSGDSSTNGRPSRVHDQIDGWIRTGIERGAAGGKLVGAGGGGFLLFYAEEKGGVRAAMAEIGLEEVRFTLDYEGATTLVSG